MTWVRAVDCDCLHALLRASSTPSDCGTGRGLQPRASHGALRLSLRVLVTWDHAQESATSAPRRYPSGLAFGRARRSGARAMAACVDGHASVCKIPNRNARMVMDAGWKLFRAHVCEAQLDLHHSQLLAYVFAAYAGRLRGLAD